jgi:hypothetical protein
MEKRFWPNWVFAVLVLFRPGSVGQEVYTLSDRKRWKLTVDLTGQSYGIYSNCGKNYLRKRFLPDNPAATTAIMDSSVEIQRFLSPQTNAGQILPWGLGIGTGPLRWASGGFLPIVQHKGAYWVLFFFRDRFPVGLNLPNGASETKDEYKNIHLLMAREFSEEVIVLSANPFRGATLAQPVFVDADAFVDFHNAQFAKVHANLRQASDSLRINIDGGFLREVDTVRTPFETEVRFHGPDMQNPETRTTRNILYTINPFELGIELIRICTFTLESNEYIIDGEYDLSREILIRRIPVLIRLSYLNKLFHDNGSSLGERVSDGDSADGKLLKGIPVEHCKIFSYDIAARHDRLQDITNMLNDNPGAKTRENLEWEREEIINQWLANYEEICDFSASLHD